MRFISFIFFLFFVSIVMHGKTKHAFKSINYETVSNKKSDDIKDIKVFNDNSKNERIILKIKNKPKGVEAVNPIILNLSINKIYIYRDFLIPIIENKYTSFLYCVVHKRGPPFI